MKEQHGDIEAAGGFGRDELAAAGAALDGGTPLAVLRSRLVKSADADWGEATRFIEAVERRRRRPFRPIEAEDFMRRPPPAWLLDGWIAQGSFTVIYGRSGSFKTFIVLGCAVSIVNGLPWMGCATCAGPVVYVAAEGGGGIGARLHAWKSEWAVERLDGLYVVPRAVNLFDQGEAEEVRHELCELGPRVIVFDTLARSMAGGDENSARDIGIVVRNIDAIRQECGAAVVVVHHTGKNGMEERGSSALRGAADTMIEVKSTGLNVDVRVSQHRDAEPPPVVRLRLEKVERSAVLRPAGQRGPEAAQAPEARSAFARIIEALREHGGERTTTSGQTLMCAMTQDDLLKALKGNHARTKVLIESAVNDPECPVARADGPRNANLYYLPS